MTELIWETSKVCYCEHASSQVALQVEVLYPSDYLPDPPRVLAHRCSHGAECNQLTKAACVWAGTNPGYDPFRP
ncbi:MAG TPA: hypothetical protein VMC09_08175 [Anaerolineales bacterium]|nr:hypothetical protein [Anaerolineales bacterium]